MEKRKRKVISMTEYNRIMDKLSLKEQDVPTTLIEMLGEAGKYEIKEKSK
uniref:Uncharacterized protein n=1 Tax=viral metagenome TaxID=1070528 RepID=A0A6M3JGU6_9ZZZZ